MSRCIRYNRCVLFIGLLDAVDKVRKIEHKQLREQGEDMLKGTKYLWLWSKENIPDWRQGEFEILKAKDLRICRAWAIKENLRHMYPLENEECQKN